MSKKKKKRKNKAVVYVNISYSIVLGNSKQEADKQHFQDLQQKILTYFFYRIRLT